MSTVFSWRQRVYYQHTDAGGVVFHSNYLNFMENARTEFLDSLGIDPGRLLRRVRDFAQVRADGEITREVADAALKMLDVDALGLDVMDRKLLLAVIEKFSGGPVGLDNLAAAIGEEASTIEDVLEPFLIQQGYLQRTLRGRMATLSAYRHFGITAPASARSGGASSGPLFDEADQ